MDIQFVDAPPPVVNRGGRPKGLRGHFVDALRANPGRWAQYPGKAGPKTAGNIKMVDPNHIAAVSRKQPDGSYIAYACWIGGDK